MMALKAKARPWPSRWLTQPRSRPTSKFPHSFDIWTFTVFTVGYIDIEGSEDNSVLTQERAIKSLMDSAQRASEKSATWCRFVSEASLKRFTQLHQPKSFGRNLEAYLKGLAL